MGVWLVHKTSGVTSFEALAAVRPPGKACHGGALDPFATGLLPVLLGKAVHVFHLIHELPKTYLATVAWGTETDNLDLHGAVVTQADASSLTAERVEATPLPLGWQPQVPPAFSNKRVRGERAWRLARRGEQVELPAQDVFLHHAQWLNHRLPHFSTLRVTVRGGFYVRSLARDLGRALGCRAHLSALHREQIGPWVCPPSLEKLDLEQALTWLPTQRLSDGDIARLRRKEPSEPTTLEAAAWPLPAGFPPLTFVRGVYRHRTVALLRRSDGRLHAWV